MKQAYKFKGDIYVNFNPEDIIGIKTNRGNYIIPYNVHPGWTDNVKTLPGPVIHPQEYDKILQRKKPEFFYVKDIEGAGKQIYSLPIFYESALILVVKELILENGETIPVDGENIINYKTVSYIPKEDIDFDVCDTIITFDGDEMKFVAKHYSCSLYRNNGDIAFPDEPHAHRKTAWRYYEKKEVPIKYSFLKEI